MKKCLCSGCGKNFLSTSSFDKHRIGKFGVDRRCMTTEAMKNGRFALSVLQQWAYNFGPVGFTTKQKKEHKAA